jgi:hypothetical protein
MTYFFKKCLIYVFILSTSFLFGQNRSQFLGIWQMKVNGQFTRGNDFGGGAAYSSYNIYYLFSNDYAYLAMSKSPSSLSPGNMDNLINRQLASGGEYSVYSHIDEVPSSIKSYFEQAGPFKPNELLIYAYVFGERMLFIFNPDLKQIRGANQASKITMVYVGPFDPAEEARVKREEIEAERMRQEALERERQIVSYMEQANSYFNDKKLNQAFSVYNEVLKLDPNHQGSKLKRDELASFFNKRYGEGYTYREENSDAYEKLLNILKSTIQEEVNSSENGEVNVDLYIEFDTNGVNLSRAANLQNEALASKINGILKSDILSPTSKYGVYTNSNDRIQLKGSWNLLSEKVISDAKGINGEGVAFKSNPSVYQKFIQSQTYPYGIYSFNTKSSEIRLNDRKDTLSSIFLTAYKLNSGPQHAFLSLLLPGWGSYKVSNGKKGVLAGLTAIAALGSSGILKVLEKIELKEYKNAETQSNAEASHESANQIRKLFLTALGVAGVTYIYDFTWSMVKGFSNIKQSKYYRETLVKGHIKVK